MDKFRVGQSVRVLPADNGEYSETDNLICYIDQAKFWDEEGQVFMYGVDIDYHVSEECLEPIYDGDQKSSWEEGVWQPRTAPSVS